MGKHRKSLSPGRHFGDGQGVGYKNIDPKHQWKKGGPSPNPTGRPRKPPPGVIDAMRQDLADFLMSDMPGGPDGRASMKVMQGLVRRLVSEGVNDGKRAERAIRLIVDLLGKSSDGTRELEPSNDEADAAIIAEFVRRQGLGLDEIDLAPDEEDDDE